MHHLDTELKQGKGEQKHKSESGVMLKHAKLKQVKLKFSNSPLQCCSYHCAGVWESGAVALPPACLLATST